MPRPPSILWIVTTQWRSQACGYAGDPDARTPEVDALASRGANFSQAVTPHPFGPFARAALLTGVPSPENGVAEYFDPLPVESRTIAHELAERGYATAFFGKWHLAPRDPGAPLVGEPHARQLVPPERRGGFGLWEGFEGGFQLNDPWLHGTRLPDPVRFAGYQSDVICDRAAAWLRERTGREPFFCVASVEPPHPPYDAEAAGVRRPDPASLTLPANVPRGGPEERRARRELAGYHAHLRATDRAIGRLVRAAGPSPVIVFTSVHGDMHGAHGLFRKGWPHEESVRVPLLVRVPGAGSSVSRSPVSLLDLCRWTLAWADGAEPETSSALAQRISMPSVVPLPDQCDRIWRGMRTARRKLIVNRDGTPWLFFDLEKDPLETRNLAGEASASAEIAESLKRWNAFL